MNIVRVGEEVRGFAVDLDPTIVKDHSRMELFKRLVSYSVENQSSNLWVSFPSQFGLRFPGMQVGP